jgi:ABC-type cobalt transport system substrate-binding protein
MADLYVIIVPVVVTMLLIASATPDPNYLGVDDKVCRIVHRMGALHRVGFPSIT